MKIVDKKKILFVMTTVGKGGSDKVAVELLNNLDNSKYDITLVSIFPGGYYSSFLNEDIHYKTILPFREERSKLYNHMFRVLIDRLPRKLLYKLFIRGKYDIEMTCEDGFGAKIIGGSKNSESKKILWEHMDVTLDESIATHFNDKQIKEYFGPFDRIVGVSKDCARKFAEKYGFKERITYVYNPIDVEDIEKKSASNKKTLKDGFNILTIGRLMPQKAYLRLVSAVDKLYKKGMNFNVSIIGEGLEDKIQLLGFKSNPYPYIKDADLLVCSSIHESYCLVVAESIVLGTPVLSTKCTGPIELLDDGKYGMLVENSEKGLREGIEKLLINKDLLDKYRNATVERRNFFSVKKCIEEFERIFEE